MSAPGPGGAAARFTTRKQEGVMSRVMHFTSRIGSALRSAARRLDDHWIGDLIGAASLFLTLWLCLVIAGVFQ